MQSSSRHAMPFYFACFYKTERRIEQVLSRLLLPVPHHNTRRRHMAWERMDTVVVSSHHWENGLETERRRVWVVECMSGAQSCYHHVDKTVVVLAALFFFLPFSFCLFFLFNQMIRIFRYYGLLSRQANVHIRLLML